MAVKASTAEDIMTEDVEFVHENDTLQTAAERLAQRDVGALPICDDQNHLRGIVTDRDIVVHAIANGRDPKQTRVSEIGTIETVTVTPDLPVQRVAELMARHRVRRLPVVDGDEIIGMVSLADVAKALAPEQTGEVVSEISST